MKIDESHQLRLYSYWRSSAAYRVRIALNLKGLGFQSIPVHLVHEGGEQHGDDYRAINPQGLVPVLWHKGQVLSQSLAICEYLDECFENYQLLPEDSLTRARIRSLALQIACEIHPLNNLRVLKYLRNQLGDEFDTVSWMSHWMMESFSSIELQLNNRDNRNFSFYGDRPGLFECFLVPQVYNAKRYAVNMHGFPLINEIVLECGKLPAFIDAAPENQPDAMPD